MSVNHQIKKGKKLLSQGQLDEAERIFREVFTNFPENPSAKAGLKSVANARTTIPGQNDRVNPKAQTIAQLLRAGNFEAAFETSSTELSKFGPTPEVLNLAALSLKGLGRYTESVAYLERAVSIDNANAPLVHNLGNLYKDMGRIEEAESSYRAALEINPEYPKAHNSLGFLLAGKMRFTEAEKHYQEAVRLSPDYALCWSNLSLMYEQEQSFQEASECLLKAISLEPNNGRFLQILASLLSRLANSDLQELDSSVLHLLLGNKEFVDAHRVFLPILNNIFPLEERRLLTDRIVSAQLGDDEQLEYLISSSLLNELLRSTPVTDLALEYILASLRSKLLAIFANGDPTPEIPGLDQFLISMSIQCFLNEYIFETSGIELGQLNLLEAKIAQCIVQQRLDRNWQLVALLSSFRSLSTYQWKEEIAQVAPLSPIYSLQVLEVQRAAGLEASIKTLSEITDSVSATVRRQYEDNPYPRWVYCSRTSEPLWPSQLSSALSLRIESADSINSTNPQILVAGCGTGRHAIQTAYRFHSSHIDAIDLSKASLGYAQMKAADMVVDNIDFYHCDILEVASLQKQYDIIESIGVLHHLEYPEKGLRTLLSVLRSGGLMRIGLYSELGRKALEPYQEKARDIVGDIKESTIRQYRKEVVHTNDSELRKLFRLHDFYTTSEFRDLVFHVQEHQFDFLKVKSLLENHGLRFCGMEIGDQALNARFKDSFAHPSSEYELDNWSEFEKQYPESFSNMYVFWVQKQ